MPTTLAYNIPTDNVAGNITWTAIASADTAYPASNISLLTDLDRGNPAKLTIKTAGGWYGDAGSAISVPLIVAWHNGDESQTLKFEAHSATLSNPATVADVTTTLTLPAKREDGFTVKVFKDMSTLSGYAAKRYYRFYFPVPGSNNSQNWGLKVWMGSVIRTLDRTFLAGQHNIDQHQLLKLSTDFGYDWIYDLQAAPRSLSGQIVTKYATSWLNLLSWYRAAGGPVKPILFIPDTSVNDAWLARFDAGVPEGVSIDRLDVSQVTSQISPVNVTFTEVTAGAPEWT